MPYEHYLGILSNSCEKPITNPEKTSGLNSFKLRFICLHLKELSSLNFQKRNENYPNEEKIGNNWSFSFIGVYCSQQKIFCQKKKKWNPKYFGVYMICDYLKPKQYEPYYSIFNYHSDLFCGRYLLLHQVRPLSPTLMFNLNYI